MPLDHWKQPLNKYRLKIGSSEVLKLIQIKNDRHLLYLQYQLSICHLENLLGMDLMYLIVIKKIKTKIKGISHELSSHAAFHYQTICTKTVQNVDKNHTNH